MVRTRAGRGPGRHTDRTLLVFLVLNSTNNLDLCLRWASLVAQMVKSLPSMQETWVQSLSREDLLEKEMVIHSSILAGKSHGWRSLASHSPWGLKELDTTERLTHTCLLMRVFGLEI